MTKIKRAITLAGGGPAVGISIGLLKRLEEEPDINFDVWSSACIGAWLTVVYQQAEKGKEMEETMKFFNHHFRPDDTYARFPIASSFAPNYPQVISNLIAYVLDPKSYQGLIVPSAIQDSAEIVLGYFTDPSKWHLGNFNHMILNGLMAANPFARFMVGAIYQTPTNGMARSYYPDNDVLKKLNFERLYDEGKPAIYHNAFNLTKSRLELFTNKPLEYNLQKITPETVCACSALPYVYEPITMGSDVYCEGATVNTVNFEKMMEFHPDLDEVWVSRILDVKQARKPENLYDALNNLVMLFASATSEDDVKLFKYHVQEKGYKVKIIDVPVATNINYDWNQSNLQLGIDDSYRAADALIKAYKEGAYDDAKPKRKKPANAAE